MLFQLRLLLTICLLAVKLCDIFLRNGASRSRHLVPITINRMGWPRDMSRGVLRSLLINCRRSEASSAVRPNRVLRARRMWASSGPRAKLLARPVRQARSWRTRTRAGHSAMVATSSNSRTNCSTSPSPPNFGGTCHQVAPDSVPAILGGL